MKISPGEFARIAQELAEEASSIEGYLSDNEMRFLALLASHPRARGVVLEIGSFKGRSTFILAAAAKLSGDEKIAAVDPLIAPSETDPDLGSDESSEEDFRRNLDEHGVTGNVEFFKAFSHELAETWDRPIRLLWIDGDHTYRGTKADLDGFLPHLSDGAIVAFHDVLHEFEGGIRVFGEDVLLSGNFGACGFVGSIAWAQYREDPKATQTFHARKLMLYKRLSRLVPYVSLGASPRGFSKKKFKLLRSLIPHGPADPETWLTDTVDCSEEN